MLSIREDRIDELVGETKNAVKDYIAVYYDFETRKFEYGLFTKKEIEKLCYDTYVARGEKILGTGVFDTVEEAIERYKSYCSFENEFDSDCEIGRSGSRYYLKDKTTGHIEDGLII